MALGLITVTGTTGKVQIYYKIGVVNYTITAGPGTLGIEDTAVDVKYTQLSGNAVATSAIFIITNSPFNYYLVSWTGIKTNNYKIISATIGDVLYTIPQIDFPSAGSNFLEVVNSLNVDTFKGTDFKITMPSDSIDPMLIDYKFIFKVAGPSLLEWKIKNGTNTSFIYLKGVSIAYPVTGYTAAPICSNVFLS